MYLFKKNTLFLIFISFLFPLSAQASELVQGFVNPSFGGNPINGGYLLSNANAQNDHTAPTKKTPPPTTASPGSEKPDSARLFAEQVNRLVMSALASRLVSKAFGSDAADNTAIDTGINTISVETALNATTVTIVDNVTGGRSVISIPNF
ncbi:curli production assembly/transport component CsgF [Nitrosomonas cryotolerans]|uniref:Curli production assembly/transport component CsgF n=1 Tax=Nitrosomonas cryotolerans ATCC 49181 TaxID=1131553 RepID=A0A1N6G438_9PROT|nr:curli assembly protein CsgF [Nitrosomonas cryotolerans]SFP52499.1 curli production assembly/transport component CsgF [Nitrosomonas cryotolerans]SIO02316.1 curli production assembly/transport component CsgF [Nitrosomonas cryotolerans ATCC 49181]